MQIIPFSTLVSPCPYLADRGSKTEYHYIIDCSFEHNSNLVKHGFRRFGRYFQKPVCDNCNECKSVRIDTFNFKFGKSHRRIYRKNEKTKILYSRPLIDFEHIELFNKYHAFMSEKKGWREHNINIKKYYEIYVEGFGEFGKELSYYDENGKLICVDLIDVVDDGLSAIYCYYDPDFTHLSLGKFSLLKQIEFARNAGLRWIYLGYLVKDCPSLNYKDEYKPYQTLLDYTEPDEVAQWDFL